MLAATADELMPTVEIVAWVVLIFLLLRILQKLQQIHALLRPNAPAPPSIFGVPGVLLRKAKITAGGLVYLVLSKDKVSKRKLASVPDFAELDGMHVERQRRIIFIRHGESMWNLVFNRGFKPSFLLRLARALLMELWQLPFDDSTFLDSPLSPLGFEQCEQLRTFLKTGISEPAARDDFDTLVNGEGRSLLVSSQLRRAAATLAIAVQERLCRSHEPIFLHSSCQEISRNVDTQSLTAKNGTPTLSGNPALESGISFDGRFNAGNKSLAFTGAARLSDFAQWASERPEPTLIVAGHSLWFRTFFQTFLPKSFKHMCKERKIVNCGTVGFTLQTGRTPEGDVRHRIDPQSIVVVYGGFSAK